MSALLLSMLLLSGPRAPADADHAFYIPKLEAMGELGPLLDAGGERSALLRRESWRSEVHPLLRVDVTRKESLLEAGLDPAGSGTLSFRGELFFSCVSLGDVKKFEAACAEKLKLYGEPFRKDADGVVVVGTRDQLGRVLAGYVLKGKESCAIGGRGSSVEKPLLELGKVLGKAPGTSAWKMAASLPGQLVIFAPEGVAGVKASGLAASVEYRSTGLRSAKLAGAGPSPYAGHAWEALLWARTRVEPAQLPPVLAQVVTTLMRVCPACDRAVFTDTATALAPALSGNALLFIERVQARGGLATVAARFFAAKGALLAEARDPKAARLALDGLSKLKGVTVLENGEGYALKLREGTVQLGVRGAQLYVATDPDVLDTLLAGLPAEAAKQAHGLEYGLDPERLARALSQVPVMEVLSVPELAGVVALSAELGPLLLASEKSTGYADTDPTGAVRGALGWTLRAP